MKKTNTTKIVSIVTLLVILCATVAGAYLGIAGRNTQMVTIIENGQSVERALYRQVAFIPNAFNKNWTEAIMPSAQLNGGYSYELTAEQGEMSDADFQKALKATAKILDKRAELLLGDASAKVENDKIIVTVAGNEYDSTLAMLLTPPGELTVCPLDETGSAIGAALLTAADVKNAGYGLDSTGNAYMLQLELTSKAKKTLNEHLGETVYIVLDGQPIAYVTLSTALTDNYLNATSTDWSTAFAAVVCAKTAALPTGYLTLANTYAAEATMSGLLDAVTIVCGVIVVLAALWMIIRAHAAGFAGALLLAGETVLFWLFTALISVNAGWKMTLSSLTLLVVCQLLFTAALVITMAKIAAAAQPRALKPALASVLKQNFKPFAVIFGALLVVGVALMLLFANTVTAISGRIVAMSAALSFVMIFVVLRVLVSCILSFKNNK